MPILEIDVSKAPNEIAMVFGDHTGMWMVSVTIITVVFDQKAWKVCAQL